MEKTPQEMKSIRMKNEYQQMINIRGEIIQWEAIKGAAPNIEEYRLNVKLRTIVGITSDDIPQYRENHVIVLTIPSSYPNSPPVAHMLTKPYPFHPNWWARDGKWCSGESWTMVESLGQFVIRMLQTLQFNPQITHADSAANGDAKVWYKRKESSGMFPIDRTVLPDPTVNREDVPAPKKAFNIVEQKQRFKINE